MRGFGEAFGRILGGFWEAFGKVLGAFGGFVGGWLNFATFVLLSAALVVFSVPVAVVVAVSVAVIVAVIMAVVVACWTWFFLRIVIAWSERSERAKRASEALWSLLWVSHAYPCFR